MCVCVHACVYNLSANILPFYIFNLELTEENKYTSHFNYIFVINIKKRNKVTKNVALFKKTHYPQYKFNSRKFVHARAIYII